MTPRKLKTDPQIVEMPPQKMAVVTGKGAPEDVFPQLMPALYGSAYTLKFDLKKQGKPTFKVTGLRARYPGIEVESKERWEHIIGLPVPDDTEVMPQKVVDVEVKLETWEYGTVAQILHLGSYSEEDDSIKRLHDFIEEYGYEIASHHEEEYLTQPSAKVVKTMIRYEIRKKG